MCVKKQGAAVMKPRLLQTSVFQNYNARPWTFALPFQSQFQICYTPNLRVCTQNNGLIRMLRNHKHVLLCKYIKMIQNDAHKQHI